MSTESIDIRSVKARQILDSRGYPTIRVRIDLDDGRFAVAAAPAGASTGTHEAAELRDRDEHYAGRGVTLAVAAVDDEINGLLAGTTWSSLADIDRAMRELDGTAQKLRLGANSIVAVSMAAARAFAITEDLALHSWIRRTLDRAGTLPVPHFNVLNGGEHARNALEFQEFMIAPVGATSMAEAVEWGASVYHSLSSLLRQLGLSTGLGDEGGFAPEIEHPEQALDLLVEAIKHAGLDPALDGVAIALDPAANSFFFEDGYTIAGKEYSSRELIDYYGKLLANYPIRSLEDPLAEGDLAAWPTLTAELGTNVQIVGDDIFVTDTDRVVTGAREHTANAVLIKPNQIGTVTETFDTLRAADRCGFGAMVSHRSGETTDTFVADLAVGSGCGQLKSGAPARGERVAKYNRLLDIAADDPEMPYGLPTLRHDLA